MKFGLFSGSFGNGLLTNEGNNQLKFSPQLNAGMSDPI